MTLDTIDQAFVARWKARRPMAEPLPSTPACEPDVTTSAEPEPQAAVVATTEPPTSVADGAETMPADAPLIAESLVERLLAAGRDQWETLADEVEAARLTGRRVIAVVGGEPGEGRTTLIECLARTLCARGRDAIVLSPDDLAGGDGRGPTDGGRQHDRRIVLVDAGIWFSPGVIRRQRLAMASDGCDAAILVRRADRDPIPARAAALTALGVAVLGEVLTFAPSSGDA